MSKRRDALRVPLAPVAAPEPPPLGAAEFAVAMAAFAPFEPHPFLAVAVSGGADSMALCLYAAEWAAGQGGRLVALTVDHGLRPGSADEAARVGAWLAARGIAHATLTWQPPATLANRQAAARAARYRLLAEWCRAAGCLHLLLAHHQGDQAETLLLRLARGSGLDGLAAMAPLRELGPCRLLRPLLDVKRARLRARLVADGQAWIEDPSNADRRYARARLRAGAALLAAEGLDPDRLAATAQRLGRARMALEAAATELLARAVMFYPAGYATLDPAALREAPRETGLRAVAQLVTCLGGAEYGPRLERLERFLDGLAAPGLAGRTLAGCRFLPWRGRLLACRELRAVAPPVALVPGGEILWDERFAVRLAPGAPPEGLTVGALGSAALPPGLRRHAAIPGAARAGLPAIRDLAGIACVPHLQYVRPDRAGLGGAVAVMLRPRRALTGPGFTVV